MIAREASLPTPVVIVDRNADVALRRDLGDVLLNHRPPITGDTLFAGFEPVEREHLDRFFAAAQPAVPALAAAR